MQRQEGVGESASGRLVSLAVVALAHPVRSLDVTARMCGKAETPRVVRTLAPAEHSALLVVTCRVSSSP